MNEEYLEAKFSQEEAENIKYLEKFQKETDSLPASHFIIMKKLNEISTKLQKIENEMARSFGKDFVAQIESKKKEYERLTKELERAKEFEQKIQEMMTKIEELKQ